MKSTLYALLLCLPLALHGQVLDLSTRTAPAISFEIDPSQAPTCIDGTTPALLRTCSFTAEVRLKGQLPSCFVSFTQGADNYYTATLRCTYTNTYFTLWNSYYPNDDTTVPYRYAPFTAPVIIPENSTTYRIDPNSFITFPEKILEGPGHNPSPKKGAKHESVRPKR